MFAAWSCPGDIKMRRHLLAAVAAVSMISGSSAALAQSAAAPLSLDPAYRAAAALDEPNDYRGGIIIPALIIIAIVGGIYLLTKDGSPASP
jgi:uncharacterized membrane protein